MREAWRWFGPDDPVSLDQVRQAGATDVVTALHHIAIGETWPLDDILVRKALIEDSGNIDAPLVWSVVESVPVHDDIKRGADTRDAFIDNFIASMRHLARAGIKVICYNFMPVIDWTRTDLSYQLPSGARALRFDQDVFAAFDLFILGREGASHDYSDAETDRAEKLFQAMSNEDIARLTSNIIAGLPGKMTDSYSLDDFRVTLAKYHGISKQALRQNLLYFLDRILPEAEKLGIRLAIHPDDPPRDMLGLPRIICTADDLAQLFHELPSAANGLTLCAGTFGSRPDNDIPAMAQQFGARIHFAHLRGVCLDQREQRSFTEASHLDSDLDMVALVKNLLQEEARRQAQGDNSDDIFIRPDHGLQILDDLEKSSNPGYWAIGRLKGLAEIRGIVRTLQAVSLI